MFGLFKKKLDGSEVLKGLTDRHSHLLPGVDDGFKKIEDTLKALEIMEHAGVSDVWFTPHIMEDVPNKPDDLRRRFEDVKKIYKGGLTLHLAAEHMLDNLFIKRLANSELLTMEDNMLLVETSYYNPPMEFDGLLGDIMNKGYRPLLAHPERYKYMDFAKYKELKNRGIKFQMNLGSIAGGYGEEARVKAEKLLKLGYYDFAGSDIHSIKHLNNIYNTPIKKSVLKRVMQISQNQ